jgi:hypothetical protein
MKHIDVWFHFICWVITDGKPKPIYCPTDDMVVNTLTKALPSAKTKHFVIELGLHMAWGGVLNDKLNARVES